MTETKFRCGNVAIVGRPNVGKSTLLNRLLGQKLSITSRKPQTTRHQILAIKTVAETQMIFVDTPGWQHRPRSRLNRSMNRQVSNALIDMDVLVMVVDARGLQPSDHNVLSQIAQRDCPKIVVLNKHDLVKSKTQLLPLIEQLSAENVFEEFIPISAKSGAHVERLVDCIRARLPLKPHSFPSDQITIHSERFFAAEIIREKLIRALGEELPYSVTVLIDDFIDEKGLTKISATIWVERDAQKGIVVGKQGLRLKQISSRARIDLEGVLGRKVFLETWVKVKGNWTDDSHALSVLGL